jgi:hypothetical protein
LIRLAFLSLTPQKSPCRHAEKVGLGEQAHD